MNCPLRTERTDLLLDYAAGRLDPSARQTLAHHIGLCPACAAYQREQSALWSTLDLWEPAPVSLDFNRRLWQRIDATAAPWYTRILTSLSFAGWKPALPVSAAILVVAVGFIFDHPRRKAAGVTSKEADQVEQTLDDIQLLQQFDAVIAPAAVNSKPM